MQEGSTWSIYGESTLDQLMSSSSNVYVKFPQLAVAVMSTGSTGLFFLQTEASAQTANPDDTSAANPVTVNRDANTGAVTVDRNAYTLETGPLINTSNIPLPAFVPSEVGEAIPPDPSGALAPSTVIFGTDSDYIRDSFNDAINSSPNNPADNSSRTYTLEEGSISVTTEITLEQEPGQHTYGEGLEVRVLDSDNNVIPDAVVTDGNGQQRNRIFVRGDGVTIGPNGEVLNTEERLTVTYTEDQQVTVRVLNLRDNNTAASESGAYFTEQGELITEDLEGGGDLDFDDGDPLNFTEGQGSAAAAEEETTVTQTTEIEETPLEPELRQEEIILEETMETVEVSEDVVTTESRTYGSVGLPDYQMTRLGHAAGVRTANDEQTVYSRYADTSQIRAGSDGISATGQLAPLSKNPAALPTLLTGELSFNPFASDNEAGFVASAGVTQFVTRTHRAATDLMGNPITTEDGPNLLEPTGWLNNRRLVGYVPAQTETVEESLLSGKMNSDRLRAVNGIFDLPADQSIVIAPPDPQTVGRGESAYSDNVGGLLIESPDGSLSFQPQWTKDGYAQTPITLTASEAIRIVYALVPQQPGQALELGESYSVEASFDGYRIADGGFRIISADQQPENFLQESADIYAVEDTLPTGNMITALFNGVQGEYIEPSGESARTVDLLLPSEVDARVGNQIYPAATIGQTPYVRTTRAAGLYISGVFSGGIGNQRDQINRSSSTLTTSTDQMRTRQVNNLFSTPVTQRSQTLLEETTTTTTTGTATFNINRQGILEDATFTPLSDPQTETAVRVLATATEPERGEEVLAETTTTESVEVLVDRTEMVTADAGSQSDSYANATPLQGELAIGGVLNFGNTPWTAAANTLRAEIFLRENILGRGASSASGWRAALTFHPFGEEQREAYQYDETGQAVALYQTEPVMDKNGQPRMEKVATATGDVVEVAINRFVLDEVGDRIPTMVGTGRSRGPGLYVRVQDTWNNRDSLTVDGGIQFSF
ncbi:MAG: hypothetical protein AAF703_09925 [Cyanobacteria bacterium P01_D01_bin.105]